MSETETVEQQFHQDTDVLRQNAIGGTLGLAFLNQARGEAEDADVADVSDIDVANAEINLGSTINVCDVPAIDIENYQAANEAIDFAISDAGKLLRNYMYTFGPGDCHIAVYDNWIRHTAWKNIFAKELVLTDKKHVVRFENLTLLRPHKTPQACRESKDTYGCEWQISCVLYQVIGLDVQGNRILVPYDMPGEKQLIPYMYRQNITIGIIPLMLKSQYCLLRGKTPAELLVMGEDPDDPGGYFIVAGAEKVVLLQEMLAINKILLMNMNGKDKLVCRMTVNTFRGTSIIELFSGKKSKMLRMKFPAMRIKKSENKEIGTKKDKKEKSEVGTKKDKGYQSMNILHVFALLGYTEFDEVWSMISSFIPVDEQKKCKTKLTNNLLRYYALPDAMFVFRRKMQNATLTSTHVDNVFNNDLFPHMNDALGPATETLIERRVRINTQKAYLLGVMTAKFLRYQRGYIDLDDRDSWSNKRFNGAGAMMELLLRSAWRKVTAIAQGTVIASKYGVINYDNTYNNKLDMILGEIVSKVGGNILTETFRDSFIGSVWGVKGNPSQAKKNIAQTLSRASVVETHSHINTINVNVERSDPSIKIRLVHNSQVGFGDPIYTPEGENCGLVKNISLTAKISVERPDACILRIINGDPSKQWPVLITTDRDEAISKNWLHVIMVNGKFTGWGDKVLIHKILLDMRRSGALYEDVTIVDDGSMFLYVDSSPSKILRPLLIVNNDTNQLVIDDKRLRGAPINELFKNGAIEYVSPWEQEFIKIAMFPNDITKRIENISKARIALSTAEDILRRVQSGEQILLEVGGDKYYTIKDAEFAVTDAKDSLSLAEGVKPFTHCEISETSFMSFAGAIIPRANCNQAPRNTYQASMAKQALGIYHVNYKNRMGDGKIKVLCEPARPLLDTEVFSVIGLDKKGPGAEAVIAFFNSPFNEEDSFVVKDSYLKNGGLRYTKYFTYSTVVSQVPVDDYSESLGKPGIGQGISEDNKHKYKFIDPESGLPFIGSYLRAGDCVIGKIRKGTGENVGSIDASTYMKVGSEGIVDKITVIKSGKDIRQELNVIVKMRITRVPKEGDKFAPRFAQKGTIGIVRAEKNMPFNKHGFSPDILINTACIPSRMTISYLQEVVISKYCAYKGIHANGTAFQEFNLDTYREVLKAYGINNIRRPTDKDEVYRNAAGYEKLRSGLTGEIINVNIFTGLVYFQALKHHAEDKIQARSQGAVKPVTRQPPKGMSIEGGLRWGEMERDAGISHGASALTLERLKLVSDGYDVVFCRRCGTMARNDYINRKYVCDMCQDKPPQFGKANIPYAYKLLMQLLAGAGINLRPEFLMPDEYRDKILKPEIDTRPITLQEVHDNNEDADEALDEEEEQAIQEEIETSYDEIF